MLGLDCQIQTVLPVGFDNPTGAVKVERIYSQLLITTNISSFSIFSRELSINALNQVCRLF